MTNNYEMKRFLMNCGMDWRDTYLEYLPEEIIQYIYKIIFNDGVQLINQFVPFVSPPPDYEYILRPLPHGNIIGDLLRPTPMRERETIKTLFVTIPMTELFPHGFGNGYRQKDFNFFVN